MDKRPDVGFNGGFEAFENDLPVNWGVYSPNTVANAVFSIEADQNLFVEGKQSLMFNVTSCSEKGGWFSPGFFGEYPEWTAGDYDVSCFVLNKGSHFRLNAGGVNNHHGNIQCLIDDTTNDQSWRHCQYQVHVADGEHLRIELNVLSTGVFRIDHISIEKVLKDR